jgi:hypothetical protein
MEKHLSFLVPKSSTGRIVSFLSLIVRERSIDVDLVWMDLLLSFLAFLAGQARAGGVGARCSQG